MPNLRDKTWTPTTPAQTADAQFWEDHLIDDASYEGLQEILEGGGGGGHVIQNPSGTEMPQQPVLQFVNATVTNGDGKTIVSGNGEKGDAATVTVGTVTTGAAGTNAQVTNSGTQYDAVLDFVIPRGADGSGSGLPSGGTNGQVLYKDTSASTGGAWGDLPDSVLSVNGETPDAQGNLELQTLPLGGTAGQALIKQSATDGDADWQTISASDVALGSGTVETLAGSIATIETSPATANHAVGEYIVYNGQLYKVTATIIAGQSLAVGANIVAVSVADNFTWQPITVDMTKLFACDIRMNGNLISISITTQNSTFNESEIITVLPENARPIAEHKFAMWNYTSDKVYMATIYPDGRIVCYGKGSITGRLVGSIMIPKA